MKTRTITCRIPITPLGKPRMTQRDKWAKRPAVIKYRQYADELRAEIHDQIGKLPHTDQITDLSWTAEFKPPKSWSKKKTEQHLGKPHKQKPDRDNIDKAVLDILFKEDSGIAAGTIRKQWSNEPALTLEITVQED